MLDAAKDVAVSAANKATELASASKSEVELSINFNKNYKGWAEARQRRQARYKL